MRNVSTLSLWNFTTKSPVSVCWTTSESLGLQEHLGEADGRASIRIDADNLRVVTIGVVGIRVPADRRSRLYVIRRRRVLRNVARRSARACQHQEDDQKLDDALGHSGNLIGLEGASYTARYSIEKLHWSGSRTRG